MLSSDAESLRDFFVKKTVQRLTYTLEPDPQLQMHIADRVQALAQRARFDLANRYWQGRDLPKRAEKALKKFIEIAVGRVRRSGVQTTAQFDEVWRTVAPSLEEYCRRFFKWLAPNVECKVHAEDTT
mgnify:CR=1 FL=1